MGLVLSLPSTKGPSYIVFGGVNVPSIMRGVRGKEEPVSWINQAPSLFSSLCRRVLLCAASVSWTSQSTLKHCVLRIIGKCAISDTRQGRVSGALLGDGLGCSLDELMPLHSSSASALRTVGLEPGTLLQANHRLRLQKPRVSADRMETCVPLLAGILFYFKCPGISTRCSFSTDIAFVFKLLDPY